QNVVTITATDPSAVEPDAGQAATSTGQFTVTRGGFSKFLGAITVNLGVSGNAVEGTDYAALPRTVNFPPGTNSQTITLTPLANASLQTGVLATMTVLSGTGYTVGSGSTASVVITPTPTATGSGLIANYYVGSSSTYGSAINFGGSTVNYSFLQTTATS